MASRPLALTRQATRPAGLTRPSRRQVRPTAVLGVAVPAALFTPGHASLGGMVLGVGTVAQLLLTGRVLGISGMARAALGSPTTWQRSFLLGLSAASIPLAFAMPSAFADLPATYTIVRAAIGGLLVGVGVSLGNGCTSGHGICGLARFSPRSLAYTMTFMATGAVAATLAQSSAAAGLATHIAPQLALPSAAFTTAALGTAASAAAAFLAIGYLGAKNTNAKPPLEAIASLLIGVTFSAGLAMSGMTSPAKVVSFLSPTLPAWDATLAFVMMGALAIATPFYQHVLRRLKAPPAASTTPVKPSLVQTFSLPTNSTIDARLLLGGVLFGAGWGLSGICPGPAIVGFWGSVGLNASALLQGLPLMAGGSLFTHTGAYLLSMAVGMQMERQLLSAPSKAHA